MKKGLRVLMLTTSFPRYRGDGAGAFLYHLGKELHRKGVHVHILAPHAPGCQHYEAFEGVRIFRFPYFLPFLYQRLCYGSGILGNMKERPILAAQLPSLILAEVIFALLSAATTRPDLVHAHWAFPQGVTALLVRKILGIPTILTIHGSDIFRLTQPILKSLNAVVIKGAGRCTANSFATADRTRTISGRDDVATIPMGVDTGLFKPVPAARSLWRFRGYEKVLLFVGRLIEVKGLAYLLEALPRVLKEYPNTGTFVIGSGPDKNRLMNLSKRLGLAKSVVFMEAVSQNELPRFYSAADVFVFPSIVSSKGEEEGLGMVLLEAMACGTPVIGTNVGGIPDIIKDEETGLLAAEKNPDDLAEKILRLFRDEPLREQVIQKGYQLVKAKFSWEIVGEEFLKIYEDVLERGRLRKSDALVAF